MVPIILLIIGIALIIINRNAIKKEEHKNKNNFGDILKSKEEDLKDFEFKLGEVRREYAENITEVQVEIEELKKSINNIIKMTKKSETMDDIIKVEDDIVEDQVTVEKEDNNVNIDNESSQQSDLNKDNVNSKILKVKELVDQGKSDDEICNELGFGKGEILLIKGLLKY